jgi:hypothetical protein
MQCSCNGTSRDPLCSRPDHRLGGKAAVQAVSTTSCEITEQPLETASMPAYLADDCTVVRSKPNDMYDVPAFSPAAHIADAYRRSAGGILVSASTTLQTSGVLSLGFPQNQNVETELATPGVVLEINSAAVDQAASITFNVQFTVPRSDGDPTEVQNTGDFRIQQKQAGRSFFVVFFYTAPADQKITYPALAALVGDHVTAVVVPTNTFNNNSPVPLYQPEQRILITYSGATPGPTLTAYNLAPQDTLWGSAMASLGGRKVVRCG